MIRVVAALLISVLAQSSPLPGTPFQPWREGYRTINAVEFSPDGQSMFIALETARVAKIEGREPAASAPEIALYESRREGDGWSRPRLLPFAGTYKDYEASLSPDGRWMVFNSWRPAPDGRTSQKNNLWLARRTATGWAEPVYLSAINRHESEESYAAIAPDGVMLFLGEGATDAFGVDYNLYHTRITGVATFTVPTRINGRRRRRSVVCARWQLRHLHSLGSSQVVGNRCRTVHHVQERRSMDDADRVERIERSHRP
jgi:hypothetical protein